MRHRVISRIGSSCTCPHCGERATAIDKPTPTSRLGTFKIEGKCKHLRNHSYARGKHHFHYGSFKEI